MPRCVDKTNAMVGIFEKLLAGRHCLEDALLSLESETISNATSLGDKAHQRLRLVSVELVEDEDPGRIGIRVYYSLDVGGEVVLRSSRSNGWQNRLACRHIKVGNEA